MLVVHVIASSFLDRTRRLDVARLDWKRHIPEPARDFRLLTRYNLDGLLVWPELTFGQPKVLETTRYWQVFRAGAVEYVGTYQSNRRSEDGLLVGEAVEEEMLMAVRAATSLLAAAGADHPMFVFVTVLGVRGRKLAGRPGEPAALAHAIDRDALVLPDAAIETASADPAGALRPIFDAFWQAGGAQRSPSYDAHGVRLT